MSVVDKSVAPALPRTKAKPAYNAAPSHREPARTLNVWENCLTNTAVVLFFHLNIRCLSLSAKSESFVKALHEVIHLLSTAHCSAELTIILLLLSTLWQVDVRAPTSKRICCSERSRQGGGG